MARIVFRDENNQTFYFDVNDRQPEVTIGRNQGNMVLIPKKALSRYHAKIIYQNRRYFLFDLNSSNGSFVNGARVQQQLEIHPGDKIVFGNVPIDFIDEMRPQMPQQMPPSVPSAPPAKPQMPPKPSAPPAMQRPPAPKPPAPKLQNFSPAIPAQSAPDLRSVSMRPISGGTYRPTMPNQPAYDDDMARLAAEQAAAASAAPNMPPKRPMTPPPGMPNSPSSGILDPTLAPNGFNPNSMGIKPQMPQRSLVSPPSPTPSYHNLPTIQPPPGFMVDPAASPASVNPNGLGLNPQMPSQNMMPPAYNDIDPSASQAPFASNQMNAAPSLNDAPSLQSPIPTAGPASLLSQEIPSAQPAASPDNQIPLSRPSMSIDGIQPAALSAASRRAVRPGAYGRSVVTEPVPSQNAGTSSTFMPAPPNATRTRAQTSRKRPQSYAIEDKFDELAQALDNNTPSDPDLNNVSPEDVVRDDSVHAENENLNDFEQNPIDEFQNALPADDDLNNDVPEEQLENDDIDDIDDIESHTQGAMDVSDLPQQNLYPELDSPQEQDDFQDDDNLSNEPEPIPEDDVPQYDQNPAELDEPIDDNPLDSSHDDAIASGADDVQNQNDLLDQIAKLKEELAIAREQADDSTQTIDMLNEAMAELKDMHNKSIQEMEQVRAQELADAKQKHQKSLELCQIDFDNALNDLRAENDRCIQKYDEKVAALEDENARQAKLIAELQNKLENIDKCTQEATQFVPKWSSRFDCLIQYIRTLERASAKLGLDSVEPKSLEYIRSMGDMIRFCSDDLKRFL